MDGLDETSYERSGIKQSVGWLLQLTAILICDVGKPTAALPTPQLVTHDTYLHTIQQALHVQYLQHFLPLLASHFITSPTPLQ